MNKTKQLSLMHAEKCKRLIEECKPKPKPLPPEPMPIPEGSKQCKRCKVIKPFAEFQRNGKYFRPTCKECEAPYYREYSRNYRKRIKLSQNDKNN